MAIKECFACEKQFEYSDSNYCSKECEAQFESELLAEIGIAKADGLISDEGIALSQGNPLSPVQAMSIMDQFKLKVKI